jgi:DNA-binding NtrC family response regulator
MTPIIPKRILIVDDEELVTWLIKVLLENKNIETETACDGIEGLSKYKSIKFDLVITDIVMPRMDGIDLAYKIMEINSTFPILLTSGAYRVELLQATGLNLDKNTAFLEKPFSAENLYDTVIRLLL